MLVNDGGRDVDEVEVEDGVDLEVSKVLDGELVVEVGSSIENQCLFRRKRECLSHLRYSMRR